MLKKKNKNAGKNKPDLKLMPNHFTHKSSAIRFWSSDTGTLVRDGRGGYKRLELK